MGETNGKLNMRIKTIAIIILISFSLASTNSMASFMKKSGDNTYLFSTDDYSKITNELIKQIIPAFREPNLSRYAYGFRLRNLRVRTSAKKLDAREFEQEEFSCQEPLPSELIKEAGFPELASNSSGMTTICYHKKLTFFYFENTNNYFSIYDDFDVDEAMRIAKAFYNRNVIYPTQVSYTDIGSIGLRAGKPYIGMSTGGCSAITSNFEFIKSKNIEKLKILSYDDQICV